MRKCVVIAVLGIVIGCSAGMHQQGRRLVEEGKYQQAIDLFYEQIRANPKDAIAWRELGVAFYEQGDPVKAEDALKQAQNIQPDPRIHLYLGLIYEQQDDFDRALEAYRVALSLNPNKSTRTMLRAHLDLLARKKVEHEISQALAGESRIDVDTIPENTIAVVDFDNTHLPLELAPISKGLAEFTALDLAKIKSLRVVDRTKIDVILKELRLSSSEYADPATAPRMGRLLGSNHIVTGSVLGIGDDEIKLDGAVVNVRDSSAQMTEAAEGNLEQIFALQKDLVMDVVSNLGITLTAEERKAIREVPTESYLAFLAYSRGLDYKSRGMFEAAESQFRQAVQLDHNFQQAAVQSKAMANAPVMEAQQSKSFEEFEADLTTASEEGGLDDDVGSFQRSSLELNGFIRNPSILDRYGNTPDAPIRIVETVGTVIVRGYLNAEP